MLGSTIERIFADPVEPPVQQQELRAVAAAEAGLEAVAVERPFEGEPVRRGPPVGEGGFPIGITALGQPQRLVGGGAVCGGTHGTRRGAQLPSLPHFYIMPATGAC